MKSTRKPSALLFATVVILLAIWTYNFLYPRIAGKIAMTFYSNITDYLSGQMQGSISEDNSAALMQFLIVNTGIKICLSAILCLMGGLAVNFYLRKRVFI